LLPYPSESTEKVGIQKKEAQMSRCFFTLPPSVFLVDQGAEFICHEKGCATSLPFSQMKIWGYPQEGGKAGKRRYFAFCGHEHTLKCLPVEYLNNA
jgi:hypothetical protein